MSYERMETALPERRRRSEAGGRIDRAEVQPAIGRARNALFAQQSPEGFWCGELTAGTTLESDYILLQLWLHQPNGAEWNPPSRPRIDRAARCILARQLPDAGFNIYHGAPARITATRRA